MKFYTTLSLSILIAAFSSASMAGGATPPGGIPVDPDLPIDPPVDLPIDLPTDPNDPSKPGDPPSQAGDWIKRITLIDAASKEVLRVMEDRSFVNMEGLWGVPLNVRVELEKGGAGSVWMRWDAQEGDVDNKSDYLVFHYVSDAQEALSDGTHSLDVKVYKKKDGGGGLFDSHSFIFHINELPEVPDDESDDDDRIINEP